MYTIHTYIKWSLAVFDWMLLVTFINDNDDDDDANNNNDDFNDDDATQ